MNLFYLWVLSIIVTVVIADQKKIGAVRYFFLALLTGPLAVLVVLFVGKYQSANTSGSIKNFEQLKNEVLGLREDLNLQSEKIKYLESLIKNSSTKEYVEEFKESAIQEKIVEPIKNNFGIPTLEEINKSQPKVSFKKSDMELDFGRNWLNKIGIAVLALGIAFLISYTFKYFGPFLKIAFGYIVALVLFFVGSKLEKTEKLMSYGRALLAGAWAIVYFTTYGMHHFEASRIIFNQTLDIFLLSFVIIGMMGHVLKYKSEGMMAVVLFVAYLTLTIGQVNEFTVISLLLLAVLNLFLVYRFQWVKILSLGLFVTYGLHLLWLMPKIMMPYSKLSLFGIAGYNSYDLMNFIFLTCYALVFFIGTHLVRVSKDIDQDKVLAATNFGNIAVYGLLAYPLILTLFYNQRLPIVLTAGAIYLVSALVMKKLDQRKMFVSDIVAAIFAITFAISLKFLPTTSILLWLIEIPLLLFIGLKFKENIYKNLSYVLTLYVVLKISFLYMFDSMAPMYFFGLWWTWHGLICFWAGVSMAASFHLTQEMKKQSELKDLDKVFDYIFSGIACLYFTTWICSFINQSWLACSLSMEGMILVTISAFLHLSRFRMYAYLILAYAAIIFISHPIDVVPSFLKWFIVSVDVLVFFILYYLVKEIKNRDSKEVYKNEAELSFVAGIILLVVAIHQYINPHWVSLSLGLSSVVIILTGFFYGNKIERMGGMVLLTLTLGRVVLIDLSGLDIIFKIITLIVLGVLFLGVSYVYNRFNIKND